MTRKLISSGSDFEALAGYSRAVVESDWVFVSGTTGFDYETGEIAEDVENQTHQALHNIQSALVKAGSKLTDVVRVRVFLAAAEDFPRIAPIIGAYFRDIRPANTTVVSALVDSRMKIEIEVTARVRID